MSLKWPRRLTLIRHARSAYNELKALKASDTLYQTFLAAYNANPSAPQTQRIARMIAKKYALKNGDHNTGFADGAIKDAVITGRRLKQLRKQVPDIVFVSPYHRTHGTLSALIQGWPELSRVETIEDERFREQEHGLSLLYNDWRVFFSLHPEQRLLYEIEGPYWYRWPQGENVPDVRNRNREAISMLVREFSGADVLVVTHHIMILSTRANLERLGVQEYLRLDEEHKPINCGVTTYTGVPNVGRHGQGKIILESYNEQLF